MRIALLLLALALCAFPARAQIVVDGGYATAAGASAVAGAAYFTLHNTGDEDDRLVAVASDAARRVMLHASVADGAVMRMVALDEGLALPAGATHRLASGGDHVMLMGLTAPLAEGDIVTLTLIFENAGEIVVDVPVANAPGQHKAGAHRGD